MAEHEDCDDLIPCIAETYERVCHLSDKIIAPDREMLMYVALSSTMAEELHNLLWRFEELLQHKLAAGNN